MTQYKSLPLTSILVGDRARPIDEDHAQAIAASMVDRGLINPITVRATPAAKGGKTPYTLVAGGHRLRAAALNGWDEIDAIIVSADAVEAQMMEIAENLYRNELSALDRAVFVLKYREIYEEKHGRIDPKGGRPKKQCNDCSVIFAPGRELSARVQEQLGFGERTYFNVTRIGQNLHPALRAAVRGTKAERDQAKLLKLCRLSADEQIRIAAALREEPDVDLAMSFLKAPKPVIDPQAQLLDRLVKAWEQASDETREEFLATIGLSEGGDRLLRSIREAAE
jgi:ParB family chromosome partitioning protein